MLRQSSAHQAKIDNFSSRLTFKQGLESKLFFLGGPNQQDSLLPVTPTRTGTTHLSLFLNPLYQTLSVQKLLYQNFKKQNWSILPSFYWKKRGNHFYVQEQGKHFVSILILRLHTSTTHITRLQRIVWCYSNKCFTVL